MFIHIEIVRTLSCANSPWGSKYQSQSVWTMHLMDYHTYDKYLWLLPSGLSPFFS